jgi:hypothetical protein
VKFEEVFQYTFKALRQKIEPEVRKEVAFIMPSMPMVEACRADAFEFFQPWIERGKLSVEQMQRACERYFLGKSKSGKPIFWMIDDMMEPLDAHIGSSWISEMLKKREPLLEYWHVQHCLFGLHLLSLAESAENAEIASQAKSLSLTDNTDNTDLPSQREVSANSALSCVPPVASEQSSSAARPICIVESEASAVVLSELFPESIWMAYATTGHLTPDLFAPLEGQTVILYPRTDPTLSTYLFFRDLVDQTLRFYDLDLSVDRTLEDYATEDQKEREIDLVDFLLENSAIIPPE